MKVNLKGPEGNAFNIMGIVKGYLRAIGEDHRVNTYLEMATMGSYEDLLEVSLKYFPSLEFETESAPTMQPTFEELKEMLIDGICLATDGCKVEPDGRCPHGHPSWLIKLGLI